MTLKRALEQYMNDFNSILNHLSRKLRKEILKRDKYRCCISGREYDPSFLDIHSIISRNDWMRFFLNFIDMSEYLLNGKHEEYLELMKFWGDNFINNPNNLITVCTDCHRDSRFQKNLTYALIHSTKPKKSSKIRCEERRNDEEGGASTPYVYLSPGSGGAGQAQLKMIPEESERIGILNGIYKKRCREWDSKKT